MTQTVEKTAKEKKQQVESPLEQELKLIRACQRHQELLLQQAERLVHEKHHYRTQLESVQPHVQQLQEGIAALTAPEQYSAVITAVSVNGERSVHVSGLNSMTCTQVSVHPSISTDSLRVGHRGLVTRERNCLIQVLGPNTQWCEIGTFEDRLDGDRILLQYGGQLVAVSISQQLALQLEGTPLRKGDLVGFDREPAAMAYARIEPPGRRELFSTDGELPTDSFEQLGGLEKQIALIKRAVDIRFRYPDIAERYNLTSKRGFLLSGPPGNGKTRLARCTAAYLRELLGDECRFMSITASQDYTMWFGESERQIRQRFAGVREVVADGYFVVVFHDEIDSIGLRRGTDFGSGAADRILNTYLAELDGIARLSNIVLIGATNRADRLDPALVRPGRYDITIDVPPPNRRSAVSILRKYLNALPLANDSTDSIDDIAERMGSLLYSPNGPYQELAHVKLADGRLLPVPGRELLSGAALEKAVQIAAEEAGWREANTGRRGLTEDDLRFAIDQQLVAKVGILTASNVQSYVLSIPEDARPISVMPVKRRVNRVS